MTEKEYTEAFLEFLKAHHEAEEAGKEEFTCPVCGGDAWWGRAAINGHLHCGCEKCGMKVIE